MHYLRYYAQESGAAGQIASPAQLFVLIVLVAIPVIISLTFADERENERFYVCQQTSAAHQIRHNY